MIEGKYRLFVLVVPFNQKVKGPALREHLFASPAKPAPREREGEQKKPDKTVGSVCSQCHV